MSSEEQLYCDVFQLKDLVDVEIPFDLAASVKFVSKKLNKRERHILFFRYWRNYTLKEIGEKLGVTEARVHQLQAVILRKLRYADSGKILCYGLEHWNREQELRKIESEKARTELVQEMQEQQEQAILEKDIKTVVEIYSQCKKFLKEYSATAEEISIEEIGLSARAFHALCRSGIATIGELSKFKTIEDLMTVRGIGRDSAEEIMKKVALYQSSVEKDSNLESGGHKKKESEEKQMESVYTFFDDDMRKELTAADLSVDIACQFIKYRDRHNLTQEQLADKLQISKEKVIELESGDYDFIISELCQFAKMLSWDITLIFSQSKPKAGEEKV